MSYDNSPIGRVGRANPYAAIAAIYEAMAELLDMTQNGQGGPQGQGGPEGHHGHHRHHGDHDRQCHGHGGPSGPGGPHGSGDSEGPGGANPAGPPSGASLGEGGDFNAGPNDALAPYAQDISNASKITGIDPNTLGAQVWAESRGDPSTTSPNSDGITTDVGLMQISPERWQNDVLPNVTDEERAKVKELTGKDVEQLDPNDEHDNVICGALEAAQHIRAKGGDVDAGLMDYMDGGDSSIGNRNYIEDIHAFADQLRNGQKLSDEDPV